MKTVASLIGLAVALLASPAAAGEAQCLWNVLAPATQDRLLAAYARGGPEDEDAVALDAAEARRQMRRCAELGGQVDPKRAVRAMNLALQGYVVQHGAALALGRLGSYGAPQLDTAWRELGPERRAALHAAAEKAPDTPADWGVEGKAALAAVIEILDRTTLLPRTDPVVQRQLEAYVAGRSVQEAHEPRF